MTSPALRRRESSASSWGRPRWRLTPKTSSPSVPCRCSAEWKVVGKSSKTHADVLMFVGRGTSASISMPGIIKQHLDQERHTATLEKENKPHLNRRVMRATLITEIVPRSAGCLFKAKHTQHTCRFFNMCCVSVQLVDPDLNPARCFFLW